MTIKVTIIGLGQIGASIGLAMGRQPEVFERIGYDEDPQTAKQAAKMGAVDKAVSLLRDPIETADVVLFALPADKVHGMMTELLPLMRPGALLLDASLNKVQSAAWAKELLPEGCSYVGLSPAINPACLDDMETGIAGARVDLFENGTIAISSPPQTSGKALEFAASLTQFLGASVMFADMLEADSMMTATHLLPQLLAAALLDATVDQPNWQDTGRMAGRAYADVSAVLHSLGTPEHLAAGAIHNREHTLRVLNNAIASLAALRDEIAAEEMDAVIARLKHAQESREQWLRNRRSGKGQPLSAAPEYDDRSLAVKLFGGWIKPKK